VRGKVLLFPPVAPFAPLCAAVGISGLLCYGSFTNNHGHLIPASELLAWVSIFRDFATMLPEQRVSGLVDIGAKQGPDR
jgi:hypothetical protein